MITPTFKPARGLIRWILDRGGFAAIVMPNRTVYICEEYLNHYAIRRHECSHLAQWDKLGTFRFWFLIIYGFLVDGYNQSPLEIEARQAETNPSHPLLTNYNWRPT